MNLSDAKPGMAVSVLMPGIDALTGQQAWLTGEILYVNIEQTTLCIKMLTGVVNKIILGCENGFSTPRVMRTRRLG